MNYELKLSDVRKWTGDAEMSQADQDIVYEILGHPATVSLFAKHPDIVKQLEQAIATARQEGVKDGLEMAAVEVDLVKAEFAASTTTADMLADIATDIRALVKETK